jgi:hypothetical protein
VGVLLFLFWRGISKLIISIFCSSWQIVNDQFQLDGLITGGLEVVAI